MALFDWSSGASAAIISPRKEKGTRQGPLSKIRYPPVAKQERTELIKFNSMGNEPDYQVLKAS